MNILPHKSWHVYNKKNIERVKRDEANARVEEEAKAERAAQAESEARLNLLRQRAQNRQGQDSDRTAVTRPVEHVNLFEKEANEHAANEEYVAEQKAKDEKWERQITMYLDKDATKESMPWYAVNEYDRFGECSTSSSFKRKEDKSNKRRKRDPIKLDQDPLAEIRSSLAKRDEKRKEKHPERRERHHDRKKHKKEPSSSKKSSSKSIEALRAQRLEREQKERARTRSYVYGEVEDSKPPLESRYSAQFNPTETSEAQKSRRRLY
ncbi:hypothetical protein BJV82DRAFT_604653 [Fennellomyces sp. T-0311]|nr:hypothetical protein BJV82DRAFT_604653 [Fennellomyces sp. T-0311]